MSDWVTPAPEQILEDIRREIDRIAAVRPRKIKAFWEDSTGQHLIYEEETPLDSMEEI